MFIPPSASPRNSSHGNGSGNAAKILSPTLNYKTTHVQQAQVGESFVKGVALGVGLAIGALTVSALVGAFSKPKPSEEQLP